MGTVPDPLRSAKLSLVTACEEENSLRELQSPECQNNQASIERNSNGYPFPAKGQHAGEHLFEVKYAAEPDVPRGERQCGYDTHQPTMFSPGSLSLSREGCRAALEPVVNSEQEASHGDKSWAPAEGCTSVQAVAEVPASQEGNQNMHSGAGGQHCSGVDQASGGVVESKAHNPSSSAHLNAQHVAPAANEIVGEMVGLEKTQAPASVKELEPVSDLGVKALACSDAELKGTKDTSSQLSARSGSEVESKTNLESPPQPSCNDQTVEKAVFELSKFRDTGTMTVPPEDGSADGAVRNKACRDAEVQAVASVESKSASTSPSILTAFLRESMPSEAKQKQEQLHIIYTGAGGKEQSEMVDNLAALVQTVPSILPEVCIQAPAAVEGWLGAQVVRRQDDLEGTGDAIRSALVDNAQHPCPPAPGSPQETAVQRTEVQRADMAGSHSDVSQPLSDNSILLKTRPVYQITVNPSNQSVAPSHPVNIETKLPPSSTPPEINSKPQHLGSSATENQQAAPSCHRVTEKTDAVTTMAGVHGSNQGEQLPAKTVGDFEIGPDGFHVDVKPKREVQLIHLDPREQEASNTGAAAGPQTMCAPISAQRELNTFPGNKKEATAAGSWNLAIGLEAELSRNSVPGLGTQKNETRKGPKLDLPAAHASAKPVPNLGGKKKDLKSATEAKVQLKQSKYVRDVVWDEQGMTWEVYGASLDPESLGIAIQNHLQRQIREHEKLIKAQSPQTRKSISSDTSSNKKLKGRHQNVFQSMLQNFRRPNCCVRPAASSVLD